MNHKVLVFMVINHVTDHVMFDLTLFLERCNMFQSSDCDNSKRCFLDLNFIDWKRFRLGHDSGYHSHYDKQGWDPWTTDLKC